VLAGLVVVVLSSPAQGYVVKLAMSATLRMLESRDERMTMLSELIYGIRQVKFLATEKSWEKRINDLRDQEVHAASRTIVQNVFMSSLYLAQPILLSVVMLSVYSFTQPQLSAATGFTSVTILSITEQAMDILPMLQMRFVNVFLFARRIESYLQLPEREPYIETSNHFELVNATICWPGCRPMSGVKPTSGLHNVNLCFPNGKLSVIVGPTGVGKSLLLSCLIGECELISGTVRAPTCKQHVYSHQRPALNWIVDNTVAYVAQTAWIEAGTIRDNIIFGSPFLANRYHEVLYACALDIDLDLLSDGDMTQVGASGVNLSGGQKSRLSLARALYSRASTLILDDIFSAVDVHTGKHLYEHALTGPLVEGRTRILATYQVELCRSGADYLVTIDAQGGCHDSFVDETQLIDVNNIEPEYSQVAAMAENEVNPVTYSRTKQRQSISSQILSLDEGFSYGETETVRPSPVIDGGQTGSVQWKTAQDFAKFSGNMYYWFAVFALFIAYGALALGRVSRYIPLMVPTNIFRDTQ
jgi:ABC-type multidrug transport system fused ATPase/permease subunit